MKLIQHSIKKTSKITDRVFYQTYSYPVYRNQHPRITRAQVIEHPYQLTYEVWKEVVKVYFEEILNYLVETGEKLLLPNGMGAIQIGVIRRLKTDRMKGRDNSAYLPSLFWFKDKSTHKCTIRNKKILMMQFAKPTFMKLFKLIKDDPFTVFKWYKDPYADNMFVNSISKVQRW